jgi:hypothetical protein
VCGRGVEKSGEQVEISDATALSLVTAAGGYNLISNRIQSNLVGADKF